jgi:hypothetical protein
MFPVQADNKPAVHIPNDLINVSGDFMKICIIEVCNLQDKDKKDKLGKKVTT